jgi:multiple sugar transport system substrate-binding protein
MKETPNVNIVLHELAFGTAQEKMWQDFAVKGGTYDIVVMLNLWFARASENDHLASIQDYIDNDKRDLNLADYPDPVIGTTQIEGENYGFPLQAGDMLVYYRKDLLEDPKGKAAFKAKYGYELRPPDTWKEWLDVAAFFNRPR